MSNSNGSGWMLTWPGMTLSSSSDLCHTPLRDRSLHDAQQAALRSLGCVRHLEEAADSHPGRSTAPAGGYEVHRACFSTDNPHLDANIVAQRMIRIVDRKLEVIGRPLPDAVRQDLVVVGQRPGGAAHEHETEDGESPASKR